MWKLIIYGVKVAYKKGSALKWYQKAVIRWGSKSNNKAYPGSPSPVLSAAGTVGGLGCLSPIRGAYLGGGE